MKTIKKAIGHFLCHFFHALKLPKVAHAIFDWGDPEVFLTASNEVVEGGFKIKIEIE